MDESKMTVKTKPGTPKKVLIVGALTALLLIIVATVLKVNSGEGAPPHTAAVKNPATVTITKEGFVPATIIVRMGSKVVWTNSDENEHAVASEPYPSNNKVKELSSPMLSTDQSYDFTFAKQGRYEYHNNAADPKHFKGVVIVTE